jgi:hypothetical protein
MNLNGLFHKAVKLVGDNSPLILTAVGVTGTVTTAVLTAKASFKASDIISQLENDIVEPIDLTPKDKVELVWQLYIPAVGTGVMTIVCIIAANRIGTRRAAAIATAYTLSERAFSEYKDKIVERLGEKKAIEIRDEIASDRVRKNPVSTKEVLVTGTGTVLCFDSMSGRYFESDMESLRKAQNDLNHMIINNTYASLHEFYEMIGLKPTAYSSEVGWNSDDLLELKFTACMSEDNRPCISIEYSTFPIRGYY